MLGRVGSLTRAGRARWASSRAAGASWRGGRSPAGCGTARRAAAGTSAPHAPSAAPRPAADAPPPDAAATARDRPRICILGGGFGGLNAAVRLDGLAWPRGARPDITLVDRADRFLFKPLMYEALTRAASPEEVTPTFADLLAPHSVRFVQGKVDAVAPRGAGQAGSVTLEDGRALPYDWLILALGAETNTDLAQGAREHAVGFATLRDLDRAGAALAALEATMAAPDGRAPVVSVVGGGYAGVELAAAVKARLGRGADVHLLSPSERLMPGQPEALVEAAEAALARAGVRVRRCRVTAVAQGRPSACPDVGKRVTLETPAGARLEERSDLVLWTAGQTPVSGAKGKPRRGLPFPLTERGCTATDATLRVVGHPHVFAIGDTAAADAQAAPDGAMPATAQAPRVQVALQQADYAAWNVWAAISGRALLPFRYQHLGTMMTFGGGLDGAVALKPPLPAGLVAAVRDSPLGGLFAAAGVNLTHPEAGVAVTGPLGALVRRGAYLWRQPTATQRLRVGRSWLDAAAARVRGADADGGATPSGGGKAGD